MSDERVVVERLCPHGRLEPHMSRPGVWYDTCSGGERRTLTPGDFRGLFYEWFRHQDLVNGATGTWKGEWTAGLADSLFTALASVAGKET